MHSIWTESVTRPAFPALEGNHKTDVLIVGGGITGVLCAYMLHRAGVDFMLVEADRVCAGVTGNTTAKITLQHGLSYDRLIRKFGIEQAKGYYQAQSEACAVYERLATEIPCDYEKKDSYVYSLRDRKGIEREVSALARIGCPAELTDAPALPFSVAGAVRIGGQAQMNPLKLLLTLAKGLPIYENTKAVFLAPHKVTTNRGEITCKKMIVATHFPILNKYGGYFLKLYQHRSYVLALENGPRMDGMYVDEAMAGLSFRNYQNMLLLGGGSHRTGKKGGAWEELAAFARAHYPQAKPVCRWATQDCMTLDGIPYIGRYAKSTADLYVATGFNKWGMTSAMVAAMLLTDLVQGKENAYVPLFSPTRGMLHPQLAINIFSSLVGLLTPTAPRCPHLGCALKYNSAEHTWDCPCHGSRFTEKGGLIEGPATDDKSGMPRKK